MKKRLLCLFYYFVILSLVMVACGASPSLIGKTEKEIIEKYGDPQANMDLGATKVLTYPNMVLEFENGKVIKQSAPSTTPRVSSKTPAKSVVEPETVSAKDDEVPMTKADLSKNPKMGEVMDFSFTAVDGRSVDLKDMRGKVVLIDFWATWCGPCVEGLPHILEVYQKYHVKGFEVIGIALDSDRRKLVNCLEEKGIPWPQHFDGKGRDNMFARKYGVYGLPILWLLDKQGKVISLDARKDLEKDVERALSKH